MKTNVIEAVLLIDKSSAHYRVELGHDEAREFLRQAEVYNGIPENISELVDAVRSAIGPMNYGLCNGQTNPNNGKYSHIQIQVGNENSRVIYVSGHRSTNSPSTVEILAGLKTVGERFNADENDCVESKSGPYEWFSWRYWWD